MRLLIGMKSGNAEEKKKRTRKRTEIEAIKKNIIRKVPSGILVARNKMMKRENKRGIETGTPDLICFLNKEILLCDIILI